jgi:4-hydroxy-4-methyl-2-oxoglutarate aldolase
MKEKIIDYIKRNRVSTTEVADCMGKAGSLGDAPIVNRGHFRVGPMRYVYAFGGTNWDVHEQIQGVQDGEMVFVDVLDNLDKAVFGDLVCKYLILYRQASAVITNGLLRDAPKLIKENWPIWCKGFNPVGYENYSVPCPESILKVIEERKQYYHDAIVVSDDTGVVIITNEFQNNDFLNKLIFIEEQEDIWLDCIDRKKLSTFETVCLKTYLEK